MPLGQDLYLQSASKGRYDSISPGVLLDVIPPNDSIAVLELITGIYCTVRRILLGLRLTNNRVRDELVSLLR